MTVGLEDDVPRHEYVQSATRTYALNRILVIHDHHVELQATPPSVIVCRIVALLGVQNAGTYDNSTVSQVHQDRDNHTRKVHRRIAKILKPQLIVVQRS